MSKILIINDEHLLHLLYINKLLTGCDFSSLFNAWQKHVNTVFNLRTLKNVYVIGSFQYDAHFVDLYAWHSQYMLWDTLLNIVQRNRTTDVIVTSLTHAPNAPYGVFSGDSVSKSIRRSCAKRGAFLGVVLVFLFVKIYFLFYLLVHY